MPDIFDQVASSGQGDVFDQVVASETTPPSPGDIFDQVATPEVSAKKKTPPEQTANQTAENQEAPPSGDIFNQIATEGTSRDFLHRELPETYPGQQPQTLPPVFREALDRAQERFQDPLAATGTTPSASQSLEQGEEPSFWQSIKEKADAASRVSPDRQALAVGLSTETGASPSFVLQNWEAARRQAGMHVEPSTGELAGYALALPVVAGAMVNPVGTALGLAGYKAADEGISGAVSAIKGELYQFGQTKTLGDLVPPESGDMVRGAADIADFIIKGAMAGAGVKGSVALADAGKRSFKWATRNKVSETTPSTQEYMSPDDLAKMHDAGANIGEFLSQLGLKPNEFSTAMNNGIDVYVPAGRKTTVTDRPWVEKLKDALGINPGYTQTTTTWDTRQAGAIPANAPRQPSQQSQGNTAPSADLDRPALTGPAQGPADTTPPPEPAPTIPGGQQPAFRLGTITGKYESGGDYGLVSTGDQWGDPGGVSYGKYQLATNTGTFDAFLKFTGEQAPTDPEARKAWWQERAKDPAFNAKQDAFILATHYEPVRQYMATTFGIDPNQSPMLAETIYAAANAHGPAGAEKILQRALDGKDPSSMSQEDLINAIYAERMKPGENGSLAYWSSSPPKVQQDVANRLVAERNDVLALSGAQGAVEGVTQTGGGAAPSAGVRLQKGVKTDLLNLTQPDAEGTAGQNTAFPTSAEQPAPSAEQELSNLLNQTGQAAPGRQRMDLLAGGTPTTATAPPPVPSPGVPSPAVIPSQPIAMQGAPLGMAPPTVIPAEGTSPTTPTAPQPPSLEELSALPTGELRALARSLGVPLKNIMKKPALAQMILDAQAAQHSIPAKVDTGAHEAATSPLNDLPQPSPAQKEAGNYQKGHARIQGLDISIENPAGSVRTGTAPDGKQWATPMVNHYGYIKGTVGKDKDHLDVFLGPDAETSQKVFVVNQVDPKTGKFDEHKVMLGFASPGQAQTAYLANYEPGWGGLGSIANMDMAGFKDWMRDGKNMRRPATSQELGDEGVDIPSKAEALWGEPTDYGLDPEDQRALEEWRKERLKDIRKNPPVDPIYNLVRGRIDASSVTPDERKQLNAKFGRSIWAKTEKGLALDELEMEMRNNPYFGATLRGTYESDQLFSYLAYSAKTNKAMKEEAADAIDREYERIARSIIEDRTAEERKRRATAGQDEASQSPEQSAAGGGQEGDGIAADDVPFSRASETTPHAPGHS